MSTTEDYSPVASSTSDADAALILKDAPLAELDEVDEVAQEAATLESIPFVQDHHRADTPTNFFVEEDNESETQDVESASFADDEAEIGTGNNEITEAIPMEVIDILQENNHPTEVHHVDHGMVLISEELQTPEQQRRAARLTAGEGSADEEFASAAMAATSTTDDPEPQMEIEKGGKSKVPKKKPTSTERRAARDAKRAEAAMTLPVNTVGSNIQIVPESTSAAKDVAETKASTEANKDATKPRKLSGKQRKARAKRLAAALETTVAAVPVSSQSGDNSHPTNAQSAAIAGDRMVETASPVVIVSGLEAAPKARKLNSKTRKARKRATEAAAAAAEAASLTLAPSVPTPTVVEAKPASAFFLSSKVDSAGAVPAEQKTKGKAGRATSEVDVSTAKQDKALPAPEQPAETVPQSARLSKQLKTNLSVDQHIALHAALTALRQGLLSRDSVIYTQQAAMKMHLLTEVCTLGYECVEGGANSFQQIAWSAPNQCLTYTTAVLNAPHQYPSSLRPKGDLKIIAPGLSLQLKCYPTFGAGSPALLGKKAFQLGFIKHFVEVAQGETDVFVFVLPAEVYRQFALEAVTSLPVVQEIKKYFSAHRVAFTNSKSAEENRMRAELCTVETGYGEFVIGSVHY